MLKVVSVIASALLLSAPFVSRAAAPPPPPAPMTTPGIPGVVASGTKIQLLIWGLDGGEGPVAAPDGSLLFAEQGANKIIRIDNNGKSATYLEETNGTTGLAFDRRGRLIGVGEAEHGRGPVAVLVLAPTRSVLVDRYQGHPILRPNDLVADTKGGVYFTETVAALSGKNLPPPPVGSRPCIFYLTPDGELIKVTEDVPRPNGIQLSPDEKTLYVVNMPSDEVMAFDVLPSGRVQRPRSFVSLSGPRGETAGDGLAVDAAGRLYVATAAGVQVFSAAGQPLGTIPVPTRPANLAFAGPDKAFLYIVGHGGAYRIATETTGFKGRAK